MSCSSAPVTATSRSMPGNVAEIALTAWATDRRVLEQAVPVGLVVALGRRRVAVARPQSASPRRARAPAGGADGGSGRSPPVRGGRSPSARPSGWAVEQFGGVVLVRRRRRAGASIVSCAPNRSWCEKRPATWTTAPTGAAARASSMSSQTTRRDAPGAVAEEQLQVLLALVPIAGGHVAHEQRLGDNAPVCQIPHVHPGDEDRDAPGRHECRKAAHYRENGPKTTGRRRSCEVRLADERLEPAASRSKKSVSRGRTAGLRHR